MTPSKSGINAAMSDTLKDRIEQRLKAVHRSAANVSKAATGNPDAIRRIYRGHMPSGDRIESIARELGTTVAWLLGRDEQPGLPESPAAEPYPFPSAPEATRALADLTSFDHAKLGKDVAVLGTAMGSDMHFDQDGISKIVEMIELDENEVIDYVRRPSGAAGRKDIYAIYHTGISMQPRYWPGQLSFIETRREPSVGDGVIVQVARPDDFDGDIRIFSVLVKTLLKRTSEYVELEQYNPPLVFRLPAKHVHRMHRVMENNDLYGI
ncbi:hypothetical protein MRBLMC3_002889 [Sphingobium sp. LMC3-1-1.1]|uniref:hypothetical protein n=1 Tax=Sphingobium sp. LMC3-1-1.1 TaxID=3135241 RepID=UPI003426A122